MIEAHQFVRHSYPILGENPVYAEIALVTWDFLVFQ